MDTANIQWDEHQCPHSGQYPDRYHPQQGAFLQANGVFIANSHLADGAKVGMQSILELGLGFGINAYATARHWQQLSKRASAHLHYIAIEKHPPKSSDLATMAEQQPELKAWYERLSAIYPPLNPGFQSQHWPDWQMTFTLIALDALEALDEWVGTVDSVYLDGFSPKANPEMWTLPLLQKVSEHCHADTCLSTYSAAAQLRRDLLSVGFSVEKKPGLNGKREHITAHFVAKQKRQGAQQQNIAILGAGISGAATANALALRGHTVTVFEQDEGTGGYFQKQQCALLRPQPRDGAPSRYANSAYQWALSKIPQDCIISQGANMHLATHHQKGKTFETQSALLKGTDDKGHRWHCPQALMVQVKSLCDHLLNHPNIQCQLSTEVHSVENQTHTVNICTENGIEHFDALILTAKVNWDILDDCPIFPVYGQLSAAHCPTHGLNESLTGQGHVMPLDKDHILFGTTFHSRHDGPIPSEAEQHEANLNILANLAPDLLEKIDRSSLKAYGGYRHTTEDHLPLVGPLFSRDTLQEHLLPRHLFERRDALDALENLSSPIWLNLAHGSKGVSSALLAGEALAGIINNNVSVLGRSTLKALNPARYWLRKARQKKS